LLICSFVRLASRHSPDFPPVETGPCLENLILSTPPPCFRKTPIWSLSTPAMVMPHHRAARFVSDEDEDDDGGTVIYSRTSSTTSLRTRFVVTKVCEPKSITTTPGLLGAGETETESEDHPVCLCFASRPQCKSFIVCHSRDNFLQLVSSSPLVQSSPPPHYNSV